MTRFLTPSKIGLLILIEIYTEAAVPTASTIPFLSFILNQIVPSTLKRESTTSTSLPRSTLSSPQPLPFLLELDDFETLLSAHPAASGFPGRTLWDQFLQKLWGIDSLDALHQFFATRSHLIAKTAEEIKRDVEYGIPEPSQDMIILSRNSPLGVFVRRAAVEFERLRFSHARELWMVLVRWRRGSLDYFARRNGVRGRWVGDKALEDGENEWGLNATEMLELVAYGLQDVDGTNPHGVSTDDVEKLLEFQVEQMQSKCIILYVS